jgi:hypothetical protein
VPFGAVDDTPVTVGALLSMTMFLVPPSDEAEPGLGRLRNALFDAPSRMVPPFVASALVAM